MLKFNPNYPSNIYHFDNEIYDAKARKEIAFAETVIPFRSKVQLFLDVGAGGGSIGYLLKQQYGIQSLSTVRPEWPYCEYMAERGNLCMISDSSKVLPFAKHTFDVVHISWVFHSETPAQLQEILMEIHRVLRPGGYFWFKDGISEGQKEAIENLMDTLGYKSLYSESRPYTGPAVTFSGNQYEMDYHSIWEKPSAIVVIDC